MGGPGVSSLPVCLQRGSLPANSNQSGGYKNKPGDTETHSAWDIIPQDPEGNQVRSLYCYRALSIH